ncbi:MAG: cytochrome c biogenesis protein ResB, partial [Phycisphaerales bacterium]|nr:cytochrome c biogenesis protein ResB [Phycisphaerales bacterium]
MNGLRRILKPIASLKITVVLFALSMFLILAGTLAQTEQGIWTVVDEYFRSLFVRVPLRLFAPQSKVHIPGAIFFPGGLTLGTLILINLLAAHIVRFKITWKRMGIILTHLGVILLLVGEFVTGAFAREGNMTIVEGGSSNYIEDTREAELALIDGSDSKDDLVVVVPESYLREPGRVISHNLLPFKVLVEAWMPNSQILGPMQSTPQQRSRANTGFGTQIAAVETPTATGVNGATVDVPSAYVTLLGDDGAIGSFLVSVFIDDPQTVVVGDKAYSI